MGIALERGRQLQFAARYVLLRALSLHALSLDAVGGFVDRESAQFVGFARPLCRDYAARR